MQIFATKTLFFTIEGEQVICSFQGTFQKQGKSNNTKFSDKILYVGSPSFRRRFWHFGERHSHPSCHPALQYCILFYGLTVTHYQLHNIIPYDIPNALNMGPSAFSPTNIFARDLPNNAFCLFRLRFR